MHTYIPQLIIRHALHQNDQLRVTQTLGRMILHTHVHIYIHTYLSSLSGIYSINITNCGSVKLLVEWTYIHTVHIYIHACIPQLIIRHTLHQNDQLWVSQALGRMVFMKEFSNEWAHVCFRARAQNDERSAVCRPEGSVEICAQLTECLCVCVYVCTHTCIHNCSLFYWHNT